MLYINNYGYSYRIQPSDVATTSTITTVPAMMNGGNGNGNGGDVTIKDEGSNAGDNSDRDDDTFEDNDGDLDHAHTDKDGDPQSQSSGDTAIQRVMKEAKVESFKDLDDVNVIIDAYECLTGNRLRIERLQKGKYHVYQCCLHVGCPFQVRFSQRRADNLYVL